jgi:hypothetical protein
MCAASQQAAVPTAGDTEYDVIQLRQHSDGAVWAEDLDTLRRQEQQAAAKRNYRRAMLLRDIQQALGPRPPLTLEQCAPTRVDAQVAFFMRHGFCILHGVLTATQLQRAQAAWAVAERLAWKEWEGGRMAVGLNKADGRTFFDIPDLLESDDVFIDVLDSPAVVPLLSRITGDHHALDTAQTLSASATKGCMWAGGLGGRVVPSQGNEDGYTRWHRDKDSSSSTDNPSYRHVKIFTNLWDIPVGGGATSFVPGTHVLPWGPEGHLARGLFRRAGATAGSENEQLPHQRLMPNYVEAALPAGSAIAFDSSGWHCSMPNTSGRPRRSCYCLYRSSENRGATGEGRNPTWPAPGGARAGIPEHMLRRLDSEGKLGIQRRRILGLPDKGTGT